MFNPKSLNFKNTVHDQLWRKLIIVVSVIVLFIGASWITEAKFLKLIENRQQVVIYLSQFLKPEWSYLSQLVKPLYETIMMSIAGTVIGVALAIPAAFLATKTVVANGWIAIIFRSFFSLIRTLPNLLLAAIFVAVVGIGQVTGILTIAVFTFGMVSQLIYEAIEQIDLGPVESNLVVGMTKFQIAIYAIWPQISRLIWNYALYAFEVNIRGSVVLGYVGAGGIGVTLQTALSFFQYGRVSVIILVILVLVMMIDYISQVLREEV